MRKNMNSPKVAVLCLIAAAIVAPRADAGTQNELASRCEQILAAASLTQSKTPTDGEDPAHNARKARAEWEIAYPICSAPGVDVALRLRSIQGYALALRAGKGLGAVEALYRAELSDALEGRHGNDAATISKLYLGLVSVLEEERKFDAALTVQLEATAHAERAFGASSRQHALELVLLGYVHQLRGDAATAEKTYRRAIAIATAECAPRCQELFQAWSFLAELLRDQPNRTAEFKEATTQAELSFQED
jgi:hypothetical protein